MKRAAELPPPFCYSSKHVLGSDGSKRRRMSAYGNDVGSTPLSLSDVTRDGFEQKVGGGIMFPGIPAEETKQNMCKTPPKVTNHSDPLGLTCLLNVLDSQIYGSVSKDIGDLFSRHNQLLSPLFGTGFPMLASLYLKSGRNHYKGMHKLAKQQNTYFPSSKVIDLEDDGVKSTTLSALREPVVIIDSDDEEIIDERPCPFQGILLPKKAGEHLDRAIVVRYDSKNGVQARGDQHLYDEVQRCEDKGEYIGVEDDEPQEDDGLLDIWKEMNMAMECSKVNDEEPFDGEDTSESEDCAHSFVLKDDLGYVCRVCGVIDRRIETIFEFQYNKGKKSTQTYMYEPRNTKEKSSGMVGLKFAEDDLTVTEISAHPRHMKQMKPHQMEGFNFLVSNLVAENPSGCIMAHAPGSGKTFMIISFMQSFLGKYPNAKPLVVLPKGILTTWKKEFQRWQVEDILLLDFYSVKADSRSQQLEVLRKWVEEKSILFLGYKQFSTIVCDSGTGATTNSCKETLLKAPTILILDEGHTPRNENTDVLQSLARVLTPRKVVLSGTLYQNHVKEVFNILNLVRPKFLKLDSSRAVRKRIMSRVNIAGVKKQFKAGAETTFFDLVEHTLQKDEDFKRKAAVIQDLREMTSNVLHYYKGDFLEELPGLVDFTVVLSLSSRQRNEVKKLRNLDRKFKICSVGSAVYLHPKLVSLSENWDSSDVKVDRVLEGLDLKDGAKAKFFLNMLNLCESADEKLLVFSQYLLPLKFLERLAVKTKGWSPGREIFAITGDSSHEQREWSMEQFNNSCEAKVFFGSIKACGEGISLVGASRIIILDVHLNPSVTRQALGRAYRPGQKKKVYVYRLVASNSPEEEDHTTCFKKELISKLWFEWNEYYGFNDFEMQTIDIQDCDDEFLESPLLRGGVEKLFKR